MTAMSKDELAAMPVEFRLNGKDVVGYASETIIETAKRHGVEIPHLCYKEGMRPDGNCRGLKGPINSAQGGLQAAWIRRAAACSAASPAIRTRPSDRSPRGRPSQSVATPPAPSTTGTRARKS